MILQFGAGNFLRGFIEVFADDLDIPVVVIQSTGRERADAINLAGGNYHVATQGFQNGKVVDETRKITSISRALHAGAEWDAVLEFGRDSSLKAIVSNTTEAGLALSPHDKHRGKKVPESFPAKLLEVLATRFEAGKSGPWILPCELVESNSSVLRDLVLEQADLWNCDSALIEWLRDECRWANTLVDRIVQGRPTDHTLLDQDPLLISAEPFAFWAVETEEENFPFAAHPAVELKADITPFTLRKVRILNGAHTALVCKATGTGMQTVKDCLADSEVSSWLERLLFDEIVPVLEGRCDDPAQFARDTLDRFRNPFLDHQLSAIVLHHETKIETRLRPTLEEYREKFGREPDLLGEILQKIDA